MRTVALLAALLGATTGCGLNLQLVDASVKKPSNVAVYFSVHNWRKQPVPNLTADSFQVYEDGKLVSVFESKQTILNPQIAAVHYTMLLMDMSGSVVNSGALSDLESAAGSFAERVGKTQQVAVYAFDGSKEIHPIVGFTSGGGTVRAGLVSLRSFKSRDPSTNLNGAVVEALTLLDRQMSHATVPLRFATLVVFTDGTDHAHRVSHDELVKMLDEKQDHIGVFMIGVGGEIDESELRSIGRSGVVLSKNPSEVKADFDKVAARVEGYTRSFYLFSYCSPARDGEHDVQIRAETKNDGSGSIAYHFNAHGFAPDCDPSTPPAFDVQHPRMRPAAAAQSK